MSPTWRIWADAPVLRCVPLTMARPWDCRRRLQSSQKEQVLSLLRFHCLETKSNVINNTLAIDVQLLLQGFHHLLPHLQYKRLPSPTTSIDAADRPGHQSNVVGPAVMHLLLLVCWHGAEVLRGKGVEPAGDVRWHGCRARYCFTAVDYEPRRLEPPLCSGS